MKKFSLTKERMEEIQISIAERKAQEESGEVPAMDPVEEAVAEEVIIPEEISEEINDGNK